MGRKIVKRPNEENNCEVMVMTIQEMTSAWAGVLAVEKREMERYTSEIS